LLRIRQTGIAQERPRERYGKYIYALQDFGLRREQVEERFRDYRERFGVEAEI
jgi:hypothetical protein